VERGGGERCDYKIRSSKSGKRRENYMKRKHKKISTHII
jgi:hypothetical protein